MNTGWTPGGLLPMREYLLIFLIAAVVTYLLCVFARELASRLGAVAKVRDRDVHSIPIPYFGGVAMLGGLMLGSAGSLTHGTVAAVDVAVGTLLVTVAILIAPTAVRRRMVLTASAVRWRVIGRVTALCRAPSNRPPRRLRLRRRGR